MPERFHYSKPTYRLGEITALPNEEGVILSGVKILINSKKKLLFFIFI
jgi:hypothetical protein